MKLLAVGSPLIDVLAHVSDDFLRQHISGVRGGRETITPAQLNALLIKLGDNINRRCGGAAANTARALAQLGGEVALFGKAGYDEPGRFFADNFQQSGGSAQELLYDPVEPTGQCLSLITPDAERTMRAELGAAQHITLDDVAQLDLTEYDIVYLEGFQLLAPYFKPLVQKAHEAGCKLVLDLGSVEVVQAVKTQLPELLQHYFYLVFANFEEAQALCDTAELSAQLKKLSAWCPVAVVKQGVQGSAVRSGHTVCQVPAHRVAQAIDTTGAGDFYAAGFLYGLISGAALKDCALYGSIISAEVVQVDGTTLPAARWAELKKQLNPAHPTTPADPNNKGENMEYQVKDINLADFGRRELDIAQEEMPGLMAARAKYGPAQPLAGVKIMGSLHMTIQTAVLIETLKCLGADIRWASCNIFSTQDHAAAAIAQDGIPVFAWKGESLTDYWNCTYKAMTWPDGSGPDQIVDDGGDATLLIHRGVAAEDNPALLDEPTEVEEVKIINALLKRVQKERPGHWHEVAKHVRGVSEETTTGVHRLEQMVRDHKLLFPAFNVNDSVTKSKFDNIYGCRHSLTDGIKRALDVMLAGKTVMVCGYGDVGKGCSEAMRNERAKVMVSEVDPICALQACMAGFTVCPVEDALPYADCYVTTTGNCRIITLEHMKKMKDQAIVCNIGHFDNEIEVAELEHCPGIQKLEIKDSSCPVTRYTFPDGHCIYLLAEGRLVNLGCATGHPSFVMSCSFTNQILAQIDIAKHPNRPVDLYLIDKKLDEEVAQLHLAKLGAKLSKLTQEQADYIGVPVDGPFKNANYRY